MGCQVPIASLVGSSLSISSDLDPDGDMVMGLGGLCLVMVCDL